MTGSLHQMFESVKKLPHAKKEHFARWVLEELNGKGTWEAALAKSQKFLEELEGEGLPKHNLAAGKTLPPMPLDD